MRNANPKPGGTSNFPRDVEQREKVRRLLGITTAALEDLAGARVLSNAPHEVGKGVGEVRGGAGVASRRADREVWRVGLELEAGDGRVIPAIYLRPTAGERFVPVVAVHQHNNEFSFGKSEPAGLAGDPDMAYGLELARLGCAVIIPDLACFEERSGVAYEKRGATEYSFLAWKLAAQGRSIQGLHVADVGLALTWLLQQPEVAEVGAGVVGHSLGGQVAFFAMAADPRFHAGVANCGVGTIASFFEADIFHNPGWYVSGIIPFGDAPAVGTALVGQQLKVIAGEQDPLFPVAGVRAVAQALPDSGKELEVFAGGHEFPDEIRRRALAWLRAQL